MTAVLEVTGVVKRFGGFTALSEVSISVGAGERLGIIGPNGSGKTTLMNVIAGRIRPDAGGVRFEGRDIGALPAWRRARIGIARSFQIPLPFGSMSVLDNLRVPLEQGGEADPPGRAAALLEDFGLFPRAAARAGDLSQVELRKLELARAVAGNPRLLISDEAMAGLSGSEIDEVLELLLRLNARGIAVVMIEHMMRAIMRFSGRVVCIEAGRIIAEGPPDAVVADPGVRRAYLGA
ncbi:ABC transporter ATP-binding protein [Roseomonas sp. KE2513]|uniref:ABC transporter ATP-binding protein n=1 Tax=Roseomonas sp. KE2513 TaxID=2479202 RepID=UPI0018DF527B|nr:ABC transporter ATP-binding protein [Roseomonas sp. KE2513]MBI0538996.1 ABC transporter ATP-binding protein [Roseomonas sp. KE2513]